jgi:hypothetical protein
MRHKRWIKRSVTGGVAVLAAAYATLSVAQTAPSDPTEPPDVLIEALQQATRSDQSSAQATGDQPAPPQGPTLVVQQMVDGDWRRRAVMNNRVVRVGDTTDAGTVEAIEFGSVSTSTEDKTEKRPVAGHEVVKHTPGEE